VIGRSVGRGWSPWSVTCLGLWRLVAFAKRDWFSIRMTADDSPTSKSSRAPPPANARLCRDEDVHACVRPVVCYRWCRSCLPVRACVRASRITYYYTLHDIPFSHHRRLTSIPPTCERTHPTRPGKTLDSALRNRQAILRHRFTRPVASIATSATKRSSKDRPHSGLPSACALLLRTRCRNRPVQHSRRLE
jgi:hypothetical protein